VIVLLMIGVFTCLVFLCVSPVISHLASGRSRETVPVKSHPIQKHTFSAR
jgi:hypothetical protein